jgi:hypothetical protein
MKIRRCVDAIITRAALQAVIDRINALQQRVGAGTDAGITDMCNTFRRLNPSPLQAQTQHG